MDDQREYMYRGICFEGVEFPGLPWTLDCPLARVREDQTAPLHHDYQDFYWVKKPG